MLKNLFARNDNMSNVLRNILTRRKYSINVLKIRQHNGIKFPNPQIQLRFLEMNIKQRAEQPHTHITLYCSSSH